MTYVDIQMYLLHYDWDYYFDRDHNIHVELDKEYYLDQKTLLNERLSKHVQMTYDNKNKEIIFIK